MKEGMDSNMFSVLMSVYAKENVNYFKISIDSILAQTLLPDEIVLIRDGQVPAEMQDTIDYYLAKYEGLFNYIPLEENKGLGNALMIGVNAAKYDLIARMDTDDIARKNRFELQIDYMSKHPNVSVLGGQIAEFIGSVENFVGKREVPTDSNSIKKYLKRRNAFNHMTVVFRKDEVIKAGNYLSTYFYEDYFLWCQMLLTGAEFANLSEVLVFARTGEALYKRRGGYKTFCSCKSFEKYKYTNGITNWFEYTTNLIIYFTFQVMLPNDLRGFIMKNMLRERIKAT